MASRKPPKGKTHRDAYNRYLRLIRAGAVGRVELGGMKGYTDHPNFALGVRKTNPEIDPEGKRLKQALSTGMQKRDPRIKKVFKPRDVDKALNPK